MFQKSKSTDMKLLRNAGLSLATADRVARNQRSGGTALIVAGGGVLILMAAIAAVSFDNQTASRSLAQVPAEAEAPEPYDETAKLTKAVTAAIQSAVQQPEPAATVSVEPVSLPVAEPAKVVQVAAPVAVLVAEPDCVDGLQTYLSPLFVQFDISGADVPASAVPLLSDISSRIAACNTAFVQIAGHSDSTGDDATNLALSWDRADNILEVMVEMGVQASALETFGYGARAPLSQGSAADDPINRRVEFRVSRMTEAAQ